jgi:hypothetical protein
MFNAEITIPEKLYNFAIEYVVDNYCLTVLQFFGTHPYTTFSKLEIVHALNASGERLYIEKALSYLVSRGAIDISSNNGNVLYSLSNDEPLRKLALALSKLDSHHWQLMLSKPADIRHEGIFGGSTCNN